MVAAGGCPPARIPEAPAPTRHQGRRHPARGRGLGNTATRSSRPGSLTANASFSYTRAAPGCPSHTRPTTASSFAGRRAAPSRRWTTTCAPSRSARVGGPERYRPGRAHRDRRAVHAGGDVAYYNGTAWVRLGRAVPPDRRGFGVLASATGSGTVNGGTAGQFSLLRGGRDRGVRHLVHDAARMVRTSGSGH
jgi:hypothetical protein